MWVVKTPSDGNPTSVMLMTGNMFWMICRLRVVPLFETVKDLRDAGIVIRKLLSIDWYKEHLITNHGGHQEV